MPGGAGTLVATPTKDAIVESSEHLFDSAADTSNPLAAARALHGEFLRAIDAEIEAVAEADMRLGIRLPKGTLLHSDGASAWYQFQLVAPLWAFHGSGWFRPIGSRPTGAVIRVDSSKHLVHLRIFGDGPWADPIPEGALLWPDSRWMLRGIQDRLTLIDQNLESESALEPPFHSATAWAALGFEDPLVALVEPAMLSPETHGSLNESQRHAVAQALGSRAAFLWGPPGTGKSRTAAAIVEAQVRSGSSVLLASPTHAASDIVLARVCERIVSEPGYGDGLVVRLGQAESPHLPPEVAEAVRYDRVLARWEAKLRKEKEELETQESRLLAAHNGIIAPSNATAYKALLDIQWRIREIPKVIRALPELILRRARLISGTLHGVVLSRRLRRAFDAVVIDEAPMGLLPAVYLVAGLARAHVSIIGDHMQLPAPVATTDPRAIVALATDPMRMAGHAEALAQGRIPAAVSVLATQYRMAPGICDIISPLYYGGLLRTDPSVPTSPSPVILIDTSGLEPQVRRVRGSRECIVHAHVATLVAQGVASKHGEAALPPKSMLLVTPYRAQARLIRMRLRHTGRRVGDVSTIHGCQGGEAEVVVVDITECEGLPPSLFLRGDDIDSVPARLINVALSRARHTLIVVADVTYLRKTGGHSIRRVVDRLAEVGRVIPARDVVLRLSA